MSPQIYMLWDSFKTFLRHHHPIIFIMLIGLLLGTAILLLYWVLTITFTQSGTNQSTISEFDKKTVEKIKNLHISSDTTNTELVFPTPRSNPFVE